MPKKRSKTQRRSRSRSSQPQPPARRVRSPAITLRKATLTIEFANERELRSRLAALVEMLDRPARQGGKGRKAAAGVAAGAAAAESCLTLFEALDVVEEALEPKNFVPSEELGDTYFTSQEREAFRARVVERVEARGCRIDAEDVPAEAKTIHSAVAGAVRDHAHR